MWWPAALVLMVIAVAVLLRPPGEGASTLRGVGHGVATTGAAVLPSRSPTPTPAPTSASPDAAARWPMPLVEDASWVTRDGTRALKVTPTQALRDETDPAAYDEAWRRVVRAVPQADTPGMRDQFVCHATFASAKQGWYLEPARPAVGYWETVKAGCNPGDVRDVG